MFNKSLLSTNYFKLSLLLNIVEDTRMQKEFSLLSAAYDLERETIQGHVVIIQWR